MEDYHRRGLLFWLGLDGLLTLGLIGLGSFISGSGYGLAIPDWPLALGAWIPPQLVAGIWYEFLHRITAATVGALTLAAGVYILVRDSRPEVRRLASTAMLLIVVQILLGGLGVWWEFPFWLKALHALIAPLFLVSLATLGTVFSWEWQEKRGSSVRFDADAFRKTRDLCLLLLLQMVLGVAVRHAAPPWVFTASLMLHLIAALGVVIAGVATPVAVLKQYRKGPLGVVGWAVIPLVLLQLAIGFAVLVLLPAGGYHELQPSPAYVTHSVTHTLLAAVLLAAAVYLAMMVRRKTALAQPPRVVRVDRLVNLR